VCVVYLAVGGFSTVGVLDIPLGALLLYYLPHIAEGSTGREKGRGGEQGPMPKGSRQELSSVYRHTKPSSRHDSADEGKRGDRHRERDRDRDRDSSQETAQVAFPFCAVDVRWLLQLNEESSTEESKVRDAVNEEDFKGIGSRLDKKTSLGFGKGKNEDSTQSIYSTTSRKEEVLDSIQFLQNSVVMITKTNSKIRTVKRTRSSSTDVSSHHAFPNLPAGASNGRIEVSGCDGIGARKEGEKEVRKEVGKVCRTPDKTTSGLSGKIKGDDVTDWDVYGMASRKDEEDVIEEVKEEVKLAGGAIYTCTLLGMSQCTLFLLLFSLPSSLSLLFFPLTRMLLLILSKCRGEFPAELTPSRNLYFYF
jgi:hypothetical protein